MIIRLSRVSAIHDLGVLFDTKMTFNDHIDCVTSKAMRSLGFLKRNTREFSSIPAIVLLYKALVLPTLEYAAVVWSPFYAVHISQLERVQHKFLRYIGYKLGIPSIDIDYPTLLDRCNLKPLQVRRSVIDMTVFGKLVRGQLDCPSLLSEVKILVPQVNTRSQTLFAVDFSPTNYLYHCPMSRLPRVANLLLQTHPDLDMFNSPISTIKKCISAIEGI